MWKRQKRLIELLDKNGFMDKELKTGCIISYVDWDKEEKTVLLHKDWCILFTGHWTINDSQLNYAIWQYHLWSLYNFFTRNDTTLEQMDNWEILASNQYGFCIELCTVKSPIEWTEEQNKELVEFMEKIIENQ